MPPGATGKTDRWRSELLAQELNNKPKLPIAEQWLHRANDPSLTTDHEPLPHLDRLLTHQMTRRNKLPTPQLIAVRRRGHRPTSLRSAPVAIPRTTVDPTTFQQNEPYLHVHSAEPHLLNNVDASISGALFWRARLCACRSRRLVMKWVTRERPKTDRIACPWLIRNFIDRDAEFLYVAAERVLEVAEREGACPAPRSRVDR